MRIACLLVPDLPLVAERRTHPDLAGAPLAIASGPGPRAELIAVSTEAARAGVRPLATVAQARAACADLVVRVASPALDRAAREALLDAALSASPRAEAAARRTGLWAAEAAVFADATGVASLFGSEAGFATALLGRARHLGLPARVAVASGREIARIAARGLGRNEESLVIPPGGDAAFLAPLPLDLLDPDDDLAQRLTRFGLRRIGDLARLPRRTLLARLGGRAVRLVALAHGEEDGPPPAPPPPRRLEESSELDFAVDRLESLGFVLRGLLSRLVARLECRGLACGELELRLGLEGGGREARRVGVAAPSLDERVLLRLVLLSLETQPPPAPVVAATLSSQGCPARPEQLDFFRPAGPAPASLGPTLAELEALCGPGRVGAPALVDSHRPGAFALAPFGRPAPPLLPTADDGAPAVRALRPPVPAEVHAPRGRPERVRSAVASGEVLGAAGPWCTSGAWWSEEEHFAFDHFDVLTSDGTVSRLRFDRLRRAWEIDAVYD